MQLRLRKEFAEWINWDEAHFLVALALGIIPEDSLFYKTKSLWWSSGPVDDAITKVMSGLVSAGILERREEPDIQYRWRFEHGLEKQS